MCLLFTICYAICLAIKDLINSINRKIARKQTQINKECLITHKVQQTSQNDTNLSQKEIISQPITEYQVLTLEELLEDD